MRERVCELAGAMKLDEGDGRVDQQENWAGFGAPAPVPRTADMRAAL
jgi:hypothetical protein